LGFIHFLNKNSSEIIFVFNFNFKTIHPTVRKNVVTLVGTLVLTKLGESWPGRVRDSAAPGRGRAGPGSLKSRARARFFRAGFWAHPGLFQALRPRISRLVL
jgi:hypothetical protein